MAIRKVNIARKPKQAAPEPAAAPQPRKGESRVVHPVNTRYAGPSGGFTKNRSRTAVPINEFGKHKDLILTDRANQILAPLKGKYKDKPFPRANLDAGVLRVAIHKGHVRHIDGSATSELAMFQFTKEALATK